VTPALLNRHRTKTHLLQNTAKMRVRLRGRLPQLRDQPVHLVEHQQRPDALQGARKTGGQAGEVRVYAAEDAALGVNNKGHKHMPRFRQSTRPPTMAPLDTHLCPRGAQHGVCLDADALQRVHDDERAVAEAAWR
jgi:hypothetical protein